MDKNKEIIIFTLIIIVLILLIVVVSFTNRKKEQEKNLFINNNNNVNNIGNEITINNENNTIEDTNEKNVENNFQTLKKQKDTCTENVSTLPSDAGLTVSGEPKTFNQDIISQANIAYLLGCENITDKTNFAEYINKNITKDGIFISKVTGYPKTDDPYDFIKENAVFMKELLLEINLSYNIDNNYLVSNKSSSNLESKINKVISSDKKIIVGFLPEYYLYINDIDNGLASGGYSNSSYVSLKPYNNIYTFIFDSNAGTIDGFFNMMEDIAKLAD